MPTAWDSSSNAAAVVSFFPVATRSKLDHWDTIVVTVSSQPTFVSLNSPIAHSKRSTSDGASPLTPGQIGGILGGIFGFILLLGLLWFYLFSRRSSYRPSSPSPPPSPPPPPPTGPRGPRRGPGPIPAPPPTRPGGRGPGGVVKPPDVPAGVYDDPNRGRTKGWTRPRVTHDDEEQVLTWSARAGIGTRSKSRKAKDLA